MPEAQLYRTRVDCRACGSPHLSKFIDLGSTPLADKFSEKSDTPEDKFPLRVFFCHDCGLVQMLDVVNDDVLFGNDYAFVTHASPSAIEHFKEYAKDVSIRLNKSHSPFNPNAGLIVDIASNDGVLLQAFKDCYFNNVLGIEPVTYIADEATKNGIETWPKFFNKQVAEEIVAAKGKAVLVTANNVVAHVDHLIDFMEGIRSLLTADGMAVLEMQYLPNLLFKNEFDNIYHEHRSFFSLTPLVTLLKKVGLEIFDVEEVDSQGGSIRVFVGCSGVITRQESVDKMLATEKELGLLDFETYKGFQARVNQIKVTLNETLSKLKAKGKHIAGYGACAKSCTLLNYCDVAKYLDYIEDKTDYKIGKFAPGSRLPVIKKNDRTPPDYYLLLIWNYLEGVLKREAEYLAKGGHFVIPIPNPTIV